MNYYNDNDPSSVRWLRGLADAGLIPYGPVDERSIHDTDPADLAQYDQCHFFAGIGGWPLALRLAGFPDSAPVWTGSCPCQPFSVAGKGLGESDPRHLWPQFRRLIGHGRPAIVFGEQVASADGRSWLARVRTDLEALGYAVGSADLCAACLAAPHIRQRLYWGAVRLADSEHADRRQELRQHGRDRTHEGRPETHGVAGARGQVLRLADAELRRSEQRHAPERRVQLTDAHRPLRRLPDAQLTRLEGHARNGEIGRQSGRLDAQASGHAAALRDLAVHWQASRWHPCDDAKARRVPLEPAFFPLAHGLPGRVGLLRGAGNAIVPQLAALFIRAFLASLPPSTPEEQP